MNSAPVVRWYVSVRSPYSWLALHGAQDELRELWERAEVRVFFEPGEVSRAEVERRGLTFPYVPMSRSKHLYILYDVRRLAARRGLRPSWPVDPDPAVWEVPSLALNELLREDPDRGRALAIRLAKARFERGENVLDRAVVGDCLRAVGADPSLADAVDDAAARRAGGEALAQVEQDGVFGVPFVRVGRDPYWGVDRLGAAQSVVVAQSVVAGRPPSSGGHQGAIPVPVGQGYGRDDHAGGCG